MAKQDLKLKNCRYAPVVGSDPPLEVVAPTLDRHSSVSTLLLIAVRCRHCGLLQCSFHMMDVELEHCRILVGQLSFLTFAPDHLQ